MSYLKERTIRIINSDRAEFLRTFADRAGKGCVLASVVEIATVLFPDRLIPRPVGAIKLGLASGVDRLDEVEQVDLIGDTVDLARQYGLGISRVIGNPSYLENVDIPSKIEQNLHFATGHHPKLDGPVVRIMVRQLSADIKTEFESHAESDTTNPLSQRRIVENKQVGWVDAVVIGLKKASK